MVLIGLIGCTPARTVVRSEPFDFGGVRATTRQFPGDSICEAEPRFLLDELSSVNGLLNHFLEGLPEDAGADWSEAAMALVEEGTTRLPPLLTQHQRSLQTLERCPFAAQGAWPSLISRGTGLLERVRARLEEAPEEIRRVQHARAVEAWQQERLAQQESARRSCPQRRVPTPRIYFAWREGLLTTWLFCDGAQITREADLRPELEPPPAELIRGRRPSDGAYHAAVGRFPAGAVLSPPTGEAVSKR